MTGWCDGVIVPKLIGFQQHHVPSSFIPFITLQFANVRDFLLIKERCCTFYPFIVAFNVEECL